MMAILITDSLPSRSKIRTSRKEFWHSAMQVRSHLAGFARPLGITPPQEKRKTHASATKAVFFFTYLDVAEAAPEAGVQQEFQYKDILLENCKRVH